MIGSKTIDFSMKFGDSVVEIQCPECLQVYHIPEKDLQNGMVYCLNRDFYEKCNARYLQKVHITDNIFFVRQASYKCKGE